MSKLGITPGLDPIQGARDASESWRRSTRYESYTRKTCTLTYYYEAKIYLVYNTVKSIYTVRVLASGWS
jgi:hypothetical protein